MRQYTPAEAEQESGVAAETLRYYERVGLLQVDRTAGGRRRFTDDDLRWIEVLRCLRLAGMSIRDMQRFAELVRLEDAGGEVADERLALLREQEAGLLAQIRQLDEALVVVRRKIGAYERLRASVG